MTLVADEVRRADIGGRARSCGYCRLSSVWQCVRHGGPSLAERKRTYMRSYMPSYRTRPDVKERERGYQKKYSARPDVKAKRRAFQARPDVMERRALRLLARARALMERR